MILPADSYIVVNKSIITDIDKNILIDLYQPIIGNQAIALYYTLFNDLEKNRCFSEAFTHHHILTVMQISLNEIKIAREKLEAVGLLKTYLRKENINNFLYILYSPVSAEEFLNHPILNVVLYNNIGKKEYQKLVNSYKVPKINLKGYDDISKNFDEVFYSVSSNFFIGNEDIASNNTNNISFKDKIDFDLIISGLESKIINEKAFSKDIRSLITNLSFIYNLDVLTIQNLIKSSLNEKGSIDKEILRKNSRNFYQFEHDGNLPTLIFSKQPEHLKTPMGDNSKKAMMIYTFENTHPYQFIKSKYKDGKVVDRDLRLVENLILDLKLTPGVVNVLLDYVLKINNQKLSKNYVETIASQWKRLGIETVEEAMNECVKNHKGTTQRIEKGKKIVKTEKTKVPEWFDQTIEKQEISTEEQQELEKLLENYK